MGRWFARLAAILAIAVIGVLAVAIPAGASITLPGDDVELKKSEGLLSGSVTVANDGTETVELTAEGLNAKGEHLCDVTPKPKRVEGQRSRSVAFAFGEDCTKESASPVLQVLEDGTAAGAPLTTKVVEGGAPDWDVLIWCLIVGGAFSLVVAVVTSILVGVLGTMRSLPTVDTASWKFGDSWATNVVAIGALLATVLAATDLLNALVVKNDIPVFIAVNLFALGLVALGPMMVSTFRARYTPPGKGPILVATGLGVMVGSLFTVAGVLVQVAALWQLFVRSGKLPTDAERAAGGALIIAGLIVGIYAVVTVTQMTSVGREVPPVVPTPPPATPPTAATPEAMQTLVDAAAAAGTPIVAVTQVEASSPARVRSPVL